MELVYLDRLNEPITHYIDMFGIVMVELVPPLLAHDVLIREVQLQIPYVVDHHLLRQVLVEIRKLFGELKIVEQTIIDDEEVQPSLKIIVHLIIHLHTIYREQIMMV